MWSQSVTGQNQAGRQAGSEQANIQAVKRSTLSKGHTYVSLKKKPRQSLHGLEWRQSGTKGWKKIKRAGLKKHTRVVVVGEGGSVMRHR